MSRRRRTKPAAKSLPTGSGTPGPLSAAMPEGWEQFGEGWMDLQPWFGWNVSAPRDFDAIGLGLAVQCADVKARDIAKTEMRLWRRQGRNWVVVEPQDHWLAKLLARKPNGSEMTWTEFWRMTVLHLELAQNAYILKRIDRIGEIRELLPLQPSRVRERIATNGRLFYEVSAATEFERSQLGESSIIVPADRMIHLRGRLMDGLTGLSNATLGHPVFELLGAISAYQTSLFGNDGKTPLVFETDHDFGSVEKSEAAFRRLKAQLTERARKAHATGDPILLEAGLKAKSIAVNSREALTTDSYNQQVLRVCGLMQTPPHKIFHYESIKYDNQAAADNQYANDCLVPTAANIEEKLRNSLLAEEEWDTYWPEFDRLAMVAGDPASMAKWVDIGLKTGALEINEARERFFQVNPIPGGDVRLVPVNMAMVDRAGNIVQQAATGQPNNDGGAQERDEQDAGEHGLRLVADNT